MCFVHSWNMGFTVIWSVASLSHNSIVGYLCSIRKSRRREINQTSSQVTLVIAPYSTSANKLDIMLYFNFHEINDSPRNTQKPLIDLLVSLHTTQSESTKAFSWTVENEEK